MKRIHLLRTRAGANEVAGLIAAAEAEGLRVGWLDLALRVPATGLDELTGAGAARAVALGGGRAVAVKRVTGPPVLRDVLREHFAGCALVLVHDDPRPEGSAPTLDVAALPLLEIAPEGWRVVSGDGVALALTTAELVSRLRRPEPWPNALRTDRRH